MSIKRFFDILCSFFLFLFLWPFFLVIFVLIFSTSKGPVIYWSKRVGKYNEIFNMPKFRTMYLDTPELASHLLKNPQKFLTPVGVWLRNFSLDELPQIWSIFIGNMSFVGPRPALYNQYDLIDLRTKFFIDQLTPGLTGWAQINGRDHLSIKKKVEFDIEYYKRRSLYFDCKILMLTILKVIFSVGIKH